MEQNKCYLVTLDPSKVTYVARVSALTKSYCILDYFRHDGEVIDFSVDRMDPRTVTILTEISREAFFKLFYSFYDTMIELEKYIKEDKPINVEDVKYEIGGAFFYYDNYGYRRIEKVVGFEDGYWQIKDLDFFEEEGAMTYSHSFDGRKRPHHDQCYYLDSEYFDKMWDMIAAMGATVDNVIKAYLPLEI